MLTSKIVKNSKVFYFDGIPFVVFRDGKYFLKYKFTLSEIDAKLALRIAYDISRLDYGKAYIKLMEYSQDYYFLYCDGIATYLSLIALDRSM